MAATARESRAAKRDIVKSLQSTTKSSAPKNSSKSSKDSKAATEKMMKKIQHMEQAHENADAEGKRELEESFQMRDPRQNREPDKMDTDEGMAVDENGQTRQASQQANPVESIENRHDANDEGYHSLDDEDELPDTETIERTAEGYFKGWFGQKYGIIGEGPRNSRRYSILAPSDSKSCTNGKGWKNDISCPIARLKAVAIYVHRKFQGNELALLNSRFSRFWVVDVEGREDWITYSKMRQFWPEARARTTVVEVVEVDDYTLLAKGASVPKVDYAIAKKAVRQQENFLKWKSGERRGEKRSPSPTPGPPQH
jgi:DNA mismatch repair ATPase MutL